MKKKLPLLLVVFCTSIIFKPVSAQDLSNPGTYMTAISNAQSEMDQKYMAYVSAAAHSKRARKIDKMRQQALESIDNSRMKTIDIPIYKGDNSLRQSSIDYMKMCYSVFNEDYARIINLEEIAEQSFDEMEAYILLQEKTNAKLKEASMKMQDANKNFAAKYNVKLIEGSDELGDKLKESGELIHYTNQVYLLFFKCNWQDGEITKAISAGKMTEAEQGRSALLRYATEGIASLEGLKSFKNDPSLANTCKRVLEFYKRTAEKSIPKQTDFFLKQENFEKMKKSFEGKSAKDRTKQDVDTFNAAVKDVNQATGEYNALVQTINKDRSDAINNWNEAERRFKDDHTPYYKK